MPEFSCRKNLITGDHFPSNLIGSSSTRRPHWLVRLLEIRDDSECVGSLISETHVLTSAYCCAEKCKDDVTCGGEKFAAVLGDWNAATWTGLEQFGVTKGNVGKDRILSVTDCLIFSYDISLLSAVKNNRKDRSVFALLSVHERVHF